MILDNGVKCFGHIYVEHYVVFRFISDVTHLVYFNDKNVIIYIIYKLKITQI